MSVSPIEPPLEVVRYKAAMPPSLRWGTIRKIAYVFWNILSIVIFPIGIIRAIGWWIKERVFAFIVPGTPDMKALNQYSGIWGLIKIIFRFLWNSNVFRADLEKEGEELLRAHHGKSIKLTAPDGAQLDGAFFPGKNRKKAIIYAFGNGQQWENTQNDIALLKSLETSVMMVNPRGVGQSRGWRSEQGYALDTYSAYEYLINKEGYDPEDIVVVGFSKGGAYGACGAALIQDKYPDKKIRALNLCSYSTMEKIAYAKLATIKSCWGFIPRLFVKAFRFDQDVKEAWDKLKGNKAIFYHSKDHIIPKVSSLYKAVKKAPVGETTLFKAKYWMHCLTDFYGEEKAHLFDQIAKALKIQPSKRVLEEHQQYMRDLERSAKYFKINFTRVKVSVVGDVA